jgi:DNA polymerase I
MNSGWMKIGEKPIILVFARDAEHPSCTKYFKVHNFKPYFYVEDVDGEIESCYGDRLSKVVCNLPSDVPTERVKYEKTFEADVLFEQRWSIDNGIEYGFDIKDRMFESVSMDHPIIPRTLFFDIEVLIPTGIMPDVGSAKYPIIAISTYDNYTDEIRIFTYKGRVVDERQVNFGTEKELLEAFAEYIYAKDFDIISGWYSEGFDVPYIMKRAMMKGADISGFSRVKNYKPNDRKWFGRSRIDYLEYFRKWSMPMGQLPSYDLKSISKKFGGFEYTDYGARMQELVDNDEWEVLVQYCINDSIALKRIEENTKVIEFYEQLRKLTGVKIEDCMSSSKMIESLLMRRGIKPMPTRYYHDDKVKIEGATVLTPPIGVVENVGVFDLKALYPSIILAFNLSPDIDKMIPKVITELMDVRDEMKRIRFAGHADDRLKTSEQSLKYVINSFYGYLAFKGSRLYSNEIAGFITKTGRDILEGIRTFSESIGYKAIYGDTDSTFLGGIDNVEVGRELEKKINQYLLEWANKNNVVSSKAPVIEFEKLYKSILFKKKIGTDEPAKKKYVGIVSWKDGVYEEKVDSKGVEFRRSDVPEVTKKLLMDFSLAVLQDKDYDKAVEMVKETYNAVKQGSLPLHDTGIPKGIRKLGNEASPHVRGIKAFESKMNRRLSMNCKPKLFYTRKGEFCIDDDVDEDEIRSMWDIDWDVMANKIIRQKLEAFIESIGYKWAFAIEGQVTMDRWFS